MANIKNCEDCYYSRPAVSEDFVFCSYVADVMAIKGVENGYDMKLAQELTKTIAFSGDVYEAYIDTGKEYPVLGPVVTKVSNCRKYKVN